MRTIKFRAWDKTSGMHLWEEILTWSVAGLFGNTTDRELMQFTGLLDKNGKEIYEGDVLKWPNKLPKGYSGDYSYVVRFEHGTFYAQKNLSTLDLSPAHFKDHEVIGNIYENPELTNPPTT